MTILQNDKKNFEINRLRLPSEKGKIDLNIVDFNNRDVTGSILYRENTAYDAWGKYNFLPPLITDDFNTFTNFSRQIRSDLDLYVSACISEPISLTCRNGTFKRLFTSLTNSSMHKKALIGQTFKPRAEIHLGKIGRDRTSFLDQDSS